MGDLEEINKVTQASAGHKNASLSVLVSSPHKPAAASLRGRPSRRVLWCLIASALALHFVFLGSLGPSAQRERLLMAPVLEVRSVAALAASVPTFEAALPMQSQAAEPPRVQPPTPRPVAKSTKAANAAKAAKSAIATLAKPSPSGLNEPAVVTAEPVSLPLAQAVQATEEAPSALPQEGDVPIYRTQLPPPVRLQYALKRGAQLGSGELLWRPADGAYQLSFEARMSGVLRFRQFSVGGIDNAGLAPLRFTDQRQRGGVQAANFQRKNDTSEGKVTFSGPATAYPLLPGTQDRLSWMVQLAAVVAAEPQRLAAGGKVVLYVVGARGAADVWVFRFVDFETIETLDGSVRAAKFSRDARRLYDTQVDAWLDPARHHLPVKARWGTSPDGDALELQLQSLQAL